LRSGTRSDARIDLPLPVRCHERRLDVDIEGDILGKGLPERIAHALGQRDAVTLTHLWIGTQSVLAPRLQRLGPRGTSRRTIVELGLMGTRRLLNRQRRLEVSLELGGRHVVAQHDDDVAMRLTTPWRHLGTTKIRQAQRSIRPRLQHERRLAAERPFTREPSIQHQPHLVIERQGLDWRQYHHALEPVLLGTRLLHSAVTRLNGMRTAHFDRAW
jgi:hypothetical protein